MAARVIEGHEPIEVKSVCCMIYGQPGARKTSLAQTSDNPITFAFDPGIYRAYGRKRAVLFDTWEDVISFDTTGHNTISIDTIGMCLDKLSEQLVRVNPKNANRSGGLSLPGYGELKDTFKQWVNRVKGNGQSLVFVAHEKADQNGDEVYYRPDITGGSYGTLMNVCDMVGYMHFDQGKKVIDFSPTDRWMAKTPPCGWKQIELPDFGAKPDFLAGLMNEAKASMGRISAMQAEVQSVMDVWRAKIAAKPPVAELNAMIDSPELKQLSDPVKKTVWTIFTQYADAQKWKFDKKSAKFAA